ncbi:pectate lyase [Qipengyuania sp. NPDC077563]|uniref:pectate lyase n=1 Tax=Qipengyuania sp. NPDC077563 TaxID=3364497 RepID=UPI00384CD95B
MIKDTHDVVVRHIRVRNDRIGNRRGSEDSITVEKSSHVIIDHVSASWARDELVNGYDRNNFITISNSVFSWGIPDHDKCALLASDPHMPQHFSFVGNLCAHSGDRNPDINFPPGSCVEVVNNVFYNARSEFAEVWESYGGTPVAIIGNTFVAGPDTLDNAVGIKRQRIASKGSAKVYATGNQFIGNFRQRDEDLSEIEVAQPACTLTILPSSAAQAYDRVLNNAGAFPRDPLDRRVVDDVRRRAGAIAKRPGAIPFFSAARAAADTDRDGMPDGWERDNGSNADFPDAWEDADGDGIANLDDWLDERHRQLTRAANSQAGA